MDMSDLDAWIRAAVRREFVPTPAEAAELRERMVRAPFLSERSLLSHIEQRLRDRQWVPPLSATEYDATLRRAIAAAEQVVVGTHRGGTLVYALVPTAAAVAEVRLGVGALPNMVVILGAERGRLISGYQYSDESKLSIPGDALWLR